MKTFTCTYSPDSNIEHTLSQYLVSNVFSIGAMAIAMEIGYLSVSPTAPVCHHGAQRAVHLRQSTSSPTLLLASTPMFAIHLSSPWLLLFESHPNCSLWELDLFSLLSQPPLSMSCPQCTGSLYSPLPPSSSPPTQLCIEFSSCFLPPQPAGGQNHDSIVWSRFRRDYHRLSRCYSETSPRIWPRCG